MHPGFRCLMVLIDSWSVYWFLCLYRAFRMAVVCSMEFAYSSDVSVSLSKSHKVPKMMNTPMIQLVCMNMNSSFLIKMGL